MVTPVRYSRGIESIDMPDGWQLKELPPIASTIVDNKYSPPETQDVRIRYFYRGVPLSSPGTASFRACLASPARLIFQYQPGEPLDPATKQLLSGLQEAMDNTGNNQMTVKGEGRPRFQLEELRTLSLNGKSVLSVQGWFYGPDMETPQDHYFGIYSDSNPQMALCEVEEVFLEARDWDDFEKYYPEFRKVLGSIRWAK